MPSVDTETQLVILADDVLEGSSAVFTTQQILKPKSTGGKEPVGSSLLTMRIDIVDVAHQAFIVKGRNVFNTGGGLYDAVNSQLTVSLGPSDLVHTDPRQVKTKHCLIFKYTYNPGPTEGRSAYIFYVQGLPLAEESL